MTNLEHVESRMNELDMMDAPQTTADQLQREEEMSKLWRAYQNLQAQECGPRIDWETI